MGQYEVLNEAFDLIRKRFEQERVDAVARGYAAADDPEEEEEEEECEEEEDEGMAGDEVDARTDRFAHQDPEGDMDRREDR